MKIDQLRNAVLSLAAEPEIQVRLYPDGICKGDELVLDFDDVYRATIKEELSQAQVEALESLDKLISSYSGKKFEDMYLEDEALFRDQRWEEIRFNAKEVIAVFDWIVDTPEKNGANYVKMDNDEIFENK